jgi:hypothetical protein
MDTSVWISVASIAVAVAALGLAVFEGMQTRLHNRLTVAPRLRFDFVIHQHEKVARITVTNVGLGPAIIESVDMLVDGDLVKVLRLEDMEMLAKSLGITSSVRFSVVRKGEVLSPTDGPQELLRVSEEAFDGQWQTINAAFRRIGYKVEYKSLYDRKMNDSGLGADFVPLAEPKIPALALVGSGELDSAPAEG